MQHLTNVGDWVFEVTQITARKAPSFGEPYSAIATIDIVDGSPVVSKLLSKDTFTKLDKLAITTFLGDLGFSDYEYLRFKGDAKLKRRNKTNECYTNA